MPRKRTYGKRRTTITIEDVSIDEFLAMACGFDPDAPAPPGAYVDVRWRSLQQMDHDYQALRQYSDSEWWFAAPPDFAEERYQANLAAGKGGVRCPAS